jgi:hypothetical protein
MGGARHPSITQFAYAAVNRGADVNLLLTKKFNGLSWP